VSWPSLRYGLPLGVAAAIAACAGLPSWLQGPGPVRLPPASAQSLVQDVIAARGGDLTGTLTWSANVGLQDLSTLEQALGGGAATTTLPAGPGPIGHGGGSGAGKGGGFDFVSLLSGSYQVQAWLDGNRGERLALFTAPAQEVDLFRWGDQAWLWDSASTSADHLVSVPLVAPGPSGGAAKFLRTLLLPSALAQFLLSGARGNTSVGVGPALVVAGQPAYRLDVAPISAPGSTVGHVEVDVGAGGQYQGTVLGVRVFAQGARSPALQIGFTGSLEAGAPSLSLVRFRPPAGVPVSSHKVTKGWLDKERRAYVSTVTGTGWDSVLEGDSAAIIFGASRQELDVLTKPVPVGPGLGRLFTTNLLNVLFMPDGDYYAGFVRPGVLEAAARKGASR
jgi:hypothetical protein